MKLIISLLCLFILSVVSANFAKAQCFANAGPDKVICSSDSTNLGGNPSAFNGTPPYSYTWATNFTLTIGETTFRYTASDFLNDTTAANPQIVDPGFYRPLKFILTVTDSEGNICKDSLTVRFSLFYESIGDYEHKIKIGDSILLQGTNIQSQLPVAKYLWRPNIGLSDSTSLNFWAKPSVSTAYYVTVTDTAGCTSVGSPFHYVYVGTTGIKEEINHKNSVKIFPNPGNKLVNIEIDASLTGNFSFDFFDSKGRKIKTLQSKSGNISLETENFPQGIIFYQIRNNKEFMATGKFIKL